MSEDLDRHLEAVRIERMKVAATFAAHSLPHWPTNCDYIHFHIHYDDGEELMLRLEAPTRTEYKKEPTKFFRSLFKIFKK